MDDAVFLVSQSVIGESEFASVAGQSLYLVARYGVGDGLVLVECGYVVVGRTGGLCRAEYTQFPLSQFVEGLRAGNFVAVVPVDVQLIGTTFYRSDHMGVPYLVE